jgi:hypothetical protein
VDKLSIHMKDFGLKLLSHAIEHLTYSAIINPYWHAFGVLHTAQAGEIIIKSCISKENPLAIFTKIPKLEQSEEISIDLLLREGKTINYTELPKVLFETTKYQIVDTNLYKEFGLLRNSIQHLGVPAKDICEPSFKFIFNIIEPIIFEFWGETVLDNLEDDVTDEYLIELLEEHYHIKYKRSV